MDKWPKFGGTPHVGPNQPSWLTLTISPPRGWFLGPVTRVVAQGPTLTEALCLA